MEDYELLQSTSFLAAADSHPVIGLIPDLLLHMTEDGCIIGYQKPRQMTLPLAPQDFLGKQLADIFPADIAEKALEKIKKTLSTENVENFYYDTHFHEKTEYFEARFIRYSPRDVLVMIRDITESTTLRKKLDFLRNYDHLTNVFNRTYFEEILSQPQLDKISIMVCDVDGLKLINDALGHAAGDKFIQDAAKILQACVRDSDQIFRIGGDEFVIIARNTRMDLLYQRIKAALEEYNAAEQNSFLSISLGWGIQTDDLSLRQLFEVADNNMYREKLRNSAKIRNLILQKILEKLETADLEKYRQIEAFEQLIEQFSCELHLSADFIENLKLLAQIHDIGTVSIPGKILLKSTSLSPEEMTLLHRHCELGFRIANMSHRYAHIAEWILKHHEDWNGQGYPLGLKEEEIPLACRIFRIADSFHAMTHQRPHRQARPAKAALEEILRGAGVQYDPLLAKKFIRMLQN